MKTPNSFQITLIWLVACVGLIYFTHPDLNNILFFHHDFQFHYFKASETFFEPNEFVDQTKLDGYAPLSSWLFAPFSFNLRTFYLFTLFFFFVFFGLILVKLSGHWVSALFWVSCSAPFFFLEGVIAQGVMTLLLLVFCFSGLKLRLFLLCLSLLTHTWGFWLLIAYWVMEIIVKTNWRGIVLGICGGTFFPAKQGLVGVKEIQTASTDINLFGFRGLNMTSWISVARWLFMYPLLPFAFMGLWKKNKVCFWFCLIGFVGAFVFLYWRIVESLMPFVVIGLTYYYQGVSKKAKVLLIIISLGLFFLQLVNYLYVVQSVHLSLTQLVFGLPCWLGWLR